MNDFLKNISENWMSLFRGCVFVSALSIILYFLFCSIFEYAVKSGKERIRTCFLLKKVSKIRKVQNITVPLIQAQHVVLVSGEILLGQDKNQDQKNQEKNVLIFQTIS